MTRRPATVVRNPWLQRVIGRHSRRRVVKPLDVVHDQLAEAMSEIALLVGVDNYAWLVIVNYIAVMQRVAAKSAPELIRDCAMTVQVSTLME